MYINFIALASQLHFVNVNDLYIAVPQAIVQSTKATERHDQDHSNHEGVCVCVFVCVCMCVHMCASMHMCAMYVSKGVNVCVYAYMQHVHVLVLYVYMCICAYAYKYTCMYVHVYLWMSVCFYLMCAMHVYACMCVNYGTAHL